jgi:hypothetical protein
MLLSPTFNLFNLLDPSVLYAINEPPLALDLLTLLYHQDLRFSLSTGPTFNLSNLFDLLNLLNPFNPFDPFDRPV